MNHTISIKSSLSAAKARQLMNLYGQLRQPFLFIIDFEMKTPYVVRPEEIQSDQLLFSINGKRNYRHIPLGFPHFELKKRPISKADYQRGFEVVQQHINAGDTYLLNLTYPTPIELNETLQTIFYHSEAKYKLWLANQFVIFSPEIFVRIYNNKIASFPMKGTIDASLPNAAQRILMDRKEKAEHCTVVDLIRNDLNEVATKVQVERFRYIDKIRTSGKDLLQVSSKISGILPLDYHNQIGDILFSLLPAGSVTGAPKKRTIEIIKAAEGYDRGYYTGVMGWFDGKNLDSGVMIRFVEQKNGQFFYKSGGGITTFSDCDKEYQEMVDKVYLPTVARSSRYETFGVND